MTAIATPKTVFDAADEMHGRGQVPTIENVIARIGGGSKSTVGPLLEAWRQKSRPNIEPMPESLEARARTLAAGIWSEAMCLMEARISGARKNFQMEIQARDVVVEQSLLPIQALEAEVQRLTTALEGEQIRCANLLVRLEKATAASDEATHLMANLELARTECAEHKLKNAKLQAENTLLREQFEIFALRRRSHVAADSKQVQRDREPGR